MIGCFVDSFLIRLFIDADNNDDDDDKEDMN